MQTIGWILILIAILLVRGASRGRSILQLPSDLMDLTNALIASDSTAMKDVLLRTGDVLKPAVAVTVDLPPGGATGGSPLDTGMPTVGNTKEALIQAGNALKGMGYKVSEHPSFGGVCTNSCHVVGSQHYIGEAIDVNADTGFRGGEKVALDNANLMAKASGFKTLWQVKDHFNHLHIAVKH